MKFERGDHLEGQCRYQHPHALSENSSNLKNNGGYSFGTLPELIPHVIIGAENFTLIEDPDKKDSHNNPGED